jgi:hypothetical protein
MGKGSTTIQAPDPIDPGTAQGEYLFGQNFGQFQGVTDPRLQQRLLDAERVGRQAYTGLELRDIETMAQGIKGGSANPRYQQLQTELASLQAEKTLKQVESEARKRHPNPTKGTGKQKKAARLRREAYIRENRPSREEERERDKGIARLQSELKSTPKTQKGTAGLFDLLEESSIRAGDLQRKQLGQQRADDVAALQRFAPQVVQAYRDADPESTRLAEMASARAGRDTGLGARGEELLGSRVQSASAAERALQRRGMSDVNARREAASAAERHLQEMGMTLGDLSPTEQEALISGRGTEFIQSTGELSPLEQRRAQQASRQASLARGREMGQGSLYDEMLARQSEELNKQERQVALGSQLLGQEAGMRGARLGQGAGMLQGSEALAARRRAEQLQRMQLGAGFIGQEEGIQSGRFGQAFGMNRALAGDAGNIILGRPSAAIGLGQQTLGQAQAGAAGPMGPQLFDPNVGINMAMQNQANQFGLLGAQAQADASRRSGFMGALGAIGGGLLGNTSLF